MKTLITKTLGLYLNTLALVAPAKAGEKGFKLFCRPFRTPLNEKQKGFLNGAEKFTIEHEGLKIQGYKWGRGGKGVLFLHGWQSHTYRWKQYIEDLPLDEYTIYSVDAPGHGLSEGNFLSVPVYSSLIQSLVRELGELEAIVSHSIGSFSVLHALHVYPLLSIRKLILMAPPGEAVDFFNFYQQTLSLSDRAMRAILDHFENVYGVKPSYFSTTSFVQSLNIPTLIVHDKLDDEAPYHYSEKIRQLNRKVSLHLTEGLGHNLRSTDVVKVVSDFVRNSVVVKQHAEHVATTVL
jgi:pimeloyl-ACP methyl ester carboxylesterase